MMLSIGIYLSLIAAAKMVEEPRSVMLVLAENERNDDFRMIEPAQCSVESLKDKTGIDFHLYYGESTDIYISESVAPLTALRQLTMLVDEATRNGGTKFAMGSPIGNICQSICENTAPRKNSQAKPGDECYGLGISVKYSFDVPGAKAFTEEICPTKNEIARPLQESLSLEEAKKFRKKRNRPVGYSLSSYVNQNYSMRPLVPGSFSQEEAVLAGIDLTSALTKAAVEVHSLFLAYRNSYSTLVASYRGQFCQPFGGIPDGQFEFNDLSPEIKQRIVDQSKFNFKGLGYESEEAVDQFFARNPKMKITFSIAVFEGSSFINPSDGRVIRSGMFIVLGNPTGP